MTRTRRPRGEGSIFQREDGRWVARVYYEDPVSGLAKRTQFTATTKSAAATRLRDIRLRLDQGSAPRDESITFGRYTRRWLESSLLASDRKASTKTLYAGLARSHIQDGELGRMPLNRLKPTTVERFITHLRSKGLSDSSVRQVYTIARAIGDSAVRDGQIAKNPFSAVRRPKVTLAEAGFLEPAQIDQLLAHAAGSRYAPLFELLACTGLRRGEALALRWADVDDDARVLKVRGTLARTGGELRTTEPKSARSRRTVPLSDPAHNVLTRIGERTATERYRAGQLWSDSGFVFVTEVGAPCDPRNALRALKAAAQSAGLPNVGLHTLRHSAASVMLSRGVPITVVSQILGHSGISITVDVYGHVAPDISRSALDVLASALSSPATTGPIR